MRGKATFDVPVRSAWSFSGLRVLLFGALIPIVLVAAAVVWAVSRPIGEAPRVASAEALDCTSSRDAWRWGCQQDRLGKEAQDPATTKRDVLTTGSVEPARRQGTAAKTAAAPSPASAQPAAVQPKPAPAAPAKAAAVETKPAPASAARVAASEPKPTVDLKAVPDVPAVKVEPARETTKLAEPVRPATTPEPATKSVATAPAAPVASPPAKREEVAAAPTPAPAAPQATTWADPAPRAATNEAGPKAPAQSDVAPKAAAPSSPASQAPLPVAAMPPDESETTGSIRSVQEQRSAPAATSKRAPAPIPTREAAAEAAAPEARAAAARPAPKAEKPARVARRSAPARREASAAPERDEAASRAPSSLRLRAARAIPRHQGGVVPALRVTSTATYVLPDGRVVTMNVAPNSDIVRSLVQRHTQAYTSPRNSRPYWDW